MTTKPNKTTGNDHGIRIRFDHTAQVYEVFADRGAEYLGCSDTIAEANRIAHQAIRERAA